MTSRRKCDKVLQYVRDNPGSTTAQITAGMPYVTVGDALRDLRKHGFVTMSGQPPRWMITALGDDQNIGWSDLRDREFFGEMVKRYF